MDKRNKNTRIKSQDDITKRYFKKKYGVENPFITIEDKADRVFKQPWATTISPAVMCFMGRLLQAGLMDKALGEVVYYGKIKQGNLYRGELIFESEVEYTEEIEHTEAYYTGKNRNK